MIEIYIVKSLLNKVSNSEGLGLSNYSLYSCITTVNLLFVYSMGMPIVWSGSFNACFSQCTQFLAYFYLLFQSLAFHIRQKSKLNVWNLLGMFFGRTLLLIKIPICMSVPVSGSVTFQFTTPRKNTNCNSLISHLLGTLQTGASSGLLCVSRSHLLIFLFLYQLVIYQYLINFDPRKQKATIIQTHSVRFWFDNLNFDPHSGCTKMDHGWLDLIW